MWGSLKGLASSSLWARSSAIVLALLVANVIFNVVSNAGFKLSAAGPNWRVFLYWQVIGNLAGFITVLTLTGLLKYIPLHVAFPVTTGLAVIGVQIFASAMYFHESISQTQWLGALLVSLGIVLMGA